MPKAGCISVKDIIENFIETVGIPVKKDESYEFVMNLYDNIMAVPYNEYKELLYKSDKFDELLEDYNDIRKKYYADVEDWVKIMNNLWLEFIINKFIDDQMPNARCCGSCQGGMINPAICLFMCMDIANEKIQEWYSWQDKTKLREEFERQMEEEYLKNENC